MWLQRMRIKLKLAKIVKTISLVYCKLGSNIVYMYLSYLLCGEIWAASSEFGTYRLCEQRRFRRACASAHVSPEPSLLAHSSSESRGTFRQKARSLAPLNGLACAVKICQDGMLKDTNSFDAAHIITCAMAKI